MPFFDLILKRIFVIVGSGFCIGIWLHQWIPEIVGSVFLFSSVLLLIAIGFAQKLTTLSGTLLVFLLFISVGYQSLEQRTSSISDEIFDEVYLPEDVVSCRITDISFSDKKWNKALVKLDFVFRDDQKIPVNEKALLLISDDVGELEKGDQLLMNPFLDEIKNKGNPGEFDAKTYWKSKGIAQMGFLSVGDFIVFDKEKNGLVNWFNRLDRMLSNLFEDRLAPAAVGIAKALILGDRDHLNSEAVRSFGNAGAMHVLAVSGLHVGLILTMLIYVLSRFPRWISKYRATVIALVIIWFYALITGFSPSVFRAVVMFSLLTIAKLSGKNYDPINVLMASAIILLLYDPLLLYDLGFQLSYLAMLGIFILYKPINSWWFFSNRLLKIIWEGTSISLAAQVFTLPLTLYFFHQYPNYFIISNLGLMALTNVILIAGILLLSIPFIPMVSAAVAWVLSILVLVLFIFVQWVETLPGSTAAGFQLTSLEVLLLFGVIAFSIYAIKKSGRWAFLGALLIAVTSFGLALQRNNNLETNEFVIFNDTQLTFCVKVDDEIHCFYSNDEQLHKTIYLAQNYQKIRPGNLTYTKLERGVYELKKQNFDFTCADSTTFYDIRFNQKQIRLIKKINFDNVKSLDKNCVYMPWLEKSGNVGHFLSAGAFVAKL